MLLFVAVGVHISCRNGGGGFAIRIIAIVQVRIDVSGKSYSIIINFLNKLET